MTTTSVNQETKHYPTYHKSGQADLPVQPHMKNYDDMARTYSWDQTIQELRLPRAKGGCNKATVCIDDHPPEVMKRPALVWESTDGKLETYTFEDLKKETSRAANLFKELGLNKGDRVFVFLERIPELYIVVFGALKTQALVGPLFAAFGPEAVKDRIQDCEARYVVTSPALKPRIDSILKDCPRSIL